MKRNTYPILALPVVLVALAGCSSSRYAGEESLQLTSLEVRYSSETDAVVFEIEAAANVATLVPEAAGQTDGAPVLGYVFLTTIAPASVGFGDVKGTVALAVTSHPDFDDTPLWDEDDNARYDDDGAVYHAHWVVLQEDSRAPAGLAVVQSDANSTLPPTAPMPMYLDSPGFTVIEDGSRLRVLVPADRLQRKLAFKTGAVTAFMKVDASGTSPLLAVHELLSQVGNGKPELSVSNADAQPASAWPTPASGDGSFDIVSVGASYDANLDTFIMSMNLASAAATQVPVPAGQVDGAPVLGYVFATSIAPSEVGFKGVAGTLVLAVTSHPDFDDTPNWDENLDANFGNDGATYHVHWAVLVEDAGSAGGLSVPSQTDPSQLPPTAPMPMYLDSPGYHAFAVGGRLSVIVPGWHLKNVQDFSYDAVTARMRVDAAGAAPVLRVEEVFEILSGDLSLPNKASRNPAVTN